MHHTNARQLPYRVHRDRRRQDGGHHRYLRRPTGRTRSALLADPDAAPTDFVRPGHVLPLRAREGGVLRRPGHTEAAVDLARLAGLAPAGALCEIVSQKERRRHGPRRRAAGVRRGPRPGADHASRDLIAYRRRIEKHVVRVAQARIPTPHGEFTAYGFDSLLDGIEHIALVRGDVGERTGPPTTARTCWCGCTRSASPATCSARCAATAARSSTPRWPPSPPRAAGWCSTCAGTRAGASACCTSCRPTSCRRRAPTPSTPTSRSGLPADARDYGTGAQILVRPRGAVDAAAHQQPGQAGRAGRVRACAWWAGCRCRCGRVPENLRYLTHQARPHGPRPARSAGHADPGTPRPARTGRAGIPW